jgi:dTDP-4-amino-4,6-dideoxygalactose transaminase
MKNKIWMSSPHMGENEFKYVKDAFDTNWIAPAGPYLPKFETSICDYTKAKHSLAVTSGTAAIHLALRLLEVQQDDIVLCQSLTFIGSAVPILYEKATPVFIDSESNASAASSIMGISYFWDILIISSILEGIPYK